MTLQESIQSLTKDNGAIRDLRDLLKITVFQVPSLQRFFRTVYNARNGEKIGWIGEMMNVGWAGGGCNPEYRTATMSFAEKTWDIGKWELPLKWCYEEFENTVAEYALRTGTDIGDIRGTDLMDIVIAPALQAAMEKMYWRMVWFSDKSAKNVNNSGDITNGVDVNLFKMTDGLWKRLLGVGASNAAQRTTIAANAEATMAQQLAAIKQQGVAVQLFEDIMDGADSRISGLNNPAIYCTETMRAALTKDLKKVYHEQLEWSQVESGIDGQEFGGIREAEFNGYHIISVPIWDRLIREFQNDGTKLNLPHRAYYGSADELLVGTPANDVISDVEMWFNQDERQVKEYATGKIGTEIGQDNLFQIAF